MFKRILSFLKLISSEHNTPEPSVDYEKLADATEVYTYRIRSLARTESLSSSTFDARIQKYEKITVKTIFDYCKHSEIFIVIKKMNVDIFEDILPTSLEQINIIIEDDSKLTEIINRCSKKIQERIRVYKFNKLKYETEDTNVVKCYQDFVTSGNISYYMDEIDFGHISFNDIFNAKVNRHNFEYLLEYCEN